MAAFTIITDEHTARAAYRKGGPVTVAETGDYLTARDIARDESRRTSGRCCVLAATARIRPEWFANGVSEG